MVHLDGDFMDEQLGIDRKKMAKKAKEEMKKKSQEQEAEFDPDEDDSFLFESSFSASGEKPLDKDGKEEELDFDNFEDGNSDNVDDWDDDWEQAMEDDEEGDLEFATPPKLKHNKDYRVFPGGPYQSELNSWRKQFGEIFQTRISGETFVWRPINRYEYKEIIAVAHTDALMREEMICETCVLFPVDYTFEQMANGKGGVPASLSSVIMEKSGFTKNFEVRKL